MIPAIHPNAAIVLDMRHIRLDWLDENPFLFKIGLPPNLATAQRQSIFTFKVLNLLLYIAQESQRTSDDTDLDLTPYLPISSA